jgi:hypothetical protein
MASLEITLVAVTLFRVRAGAAERGSIAGPTFYVCWGIYLTHLLPDAKRCSAYFRILFTAIGPTLGWMGFDDRPMRVPWRWRAVLMIDSILIINGGEIEEVRENALGRWRDGAATIVVLGLLLANLSSIAQAFMGRRTAARRPPLATRRPQRAMFELQEKCERFCVKIDVADAEARKSLRGNDSRVEAAREESRFRKILSQPRTPRVRDCPANAMFQIVTGGDPTKSGRPNAFAWAAVCLVRVSLPHVAPGMGTKRNRGAAKTHSYECNSTLPIAGGSAPVSTLAKQRIFGRVSLLREKRRFGGARWMCDR